MEKYIHKINKYKNTDKIKYNKYLNRLKKIKNINGGIFNDNELKKDIYYNNKIFINQMFKKYIDNNFFKESNNKDNKDINENIQNLILKNFYKISIIDSIENGYNKNINGLYNLEKAFELIDKDSELIYKNKSDNKKNIIIDTNTNIIKYYDEDMFKMIKILKKLKIINDENKFDNNKLSLIIKNINEIQLKNKMSSYLKNINNDVHTNIINILKNQKELENIKYFEYKEENNKITKIDTRKINIDNNNDILIKNLLEFYIYVFYYKLIKNVEEFKFEREIILNKIYNNISIISKNDIIDINNNNFIDKHYEMIKYIEKILYIYHIYNIYNKNKDNKYDNIKRYYKVFFDYHNRNEKNEKIVLK